MNAINQEGANRRKKVLFLITKATWGGAQKYVFDLATHFETAKYEPLVAFGTTGKLSGDLEKAGIGTCEIPSLGRDIAVLSDIKSFFQIIRCIRSVRPDVLHLNSSKAAALGALAGRLCGVPRIIFTVHGWPFKEDRGVIARGLIRFISWFTAVLSHTVIVVSKTDESIGRSMSLIAGRICYIPHGLKKLEFLSREKALLSLNVSAASPRIVTIAELTPNKGIRYAIEAVALLKERGSAVSYFVIGEGEQRAYLERLAHIRGVADRVQFLGFIPDAVKYLKAFDVFVLPSIKEGTPYVLIEAEIAGLPIVATDVIDAFWKASGIVTLVPVANISLLAQAVEQAKEQTVDATVQPFSTLDIMVEKTTALYF